MIELAKSKLFTPWTNPDTGVTVYLLTQKVAPLQQTFYYVNDGMTRDGRYLWFYCAFPPSALKTLGGIDFEADARVHNALSDVNRLKILKLLGFREMCVCELTAALAMNQPNLSYHIKKLENAGLVRSERRGKWVYYSMEKSETRVLLLPLFHG